jgi:hypothetical protein
MDSEITVPKPDHISDLERRRKTLEEEIASALLHCSTDELMIVDLNRRLLHLRDEIFRHHHEDVKHKRHY